MPVLKSKQLVWKCLTSGCDYEINTSDKEERLTNGFEHQVSVHNLTEENRDWFNTHIKNYYSIS